MSESKSSLVFSCSSDALSILAELRNSSILRPLKLRSNKPVNWKSSLVKFSFEVCLGKVTKYIKHGFLATEINFYVTGKIKIWIVRFEISIEFLHSYCLKAQVFIEIVVELQ